jgi:hypothetical protein
MARMRLVSTLPLVGALLGVQPVAAQFSSILDNLLRPPADVPTPPSRGPAVPPPGDVDDSDPMRARGGYGSRGAVYTAPAGSPSAERAPAGIEAQPLAPLPGTEPTDVQRSDQPGLGLPQLPAGQPQQGSGAPQGRAPGQRQTPGTPQSANAIQQPSDEVAIEPPAQKIVNPTAVFSGLDKITGRTITFDIAINETVQFGALQVTPRACYTRPPTEPPNTDGFVQVDEITLQGEVRRIFSGWMFAASPGLHAVEHPIYDVWLVDCKNGPSVAATTLAPSTAQAAQATALSATAPTAPATGSGAPAAPPASAKPKH